MDEWRQKCELLNQEIEGLKQGQRVLNTEINQLKNELNENLEKVNFWVYLIF